MFRKADPFDETKPSHISNYSEKKNLQLNYYLSYQMHFIKTIVRNILYEISRNLKEATDIGDPASVTFMDLSKVFATLNNHDLLIAKLEAYGLFANSLSYIYSYINKPINLSL